MCGIFACVNTSGNDVSAIALSGLQRLRYRGYDSFGFASWLKEGYATKQGCTPGSASIAVTRSLEELDDSVGLPFSSAVIAHTRWATHGRVTLENCHPLVSSDGCFALIHNGVVENFQALSSSIEYIEVQLAGCPPGQAESDSAVIMAMLESVFGKLNRPPVNRSLDQGANAPMGAGRLAASADILDAVRTVMSKLEGLNSIVLLLEDGRIIGFRQGTPLIVGRDGSHYYLASDVNAFGGMVDEICLLASGDALLINPNQPDADEPAILFTRQTCQPGGSSTPVWQGLESGRFERNRSGSSVEADGRQGYPHFMLKEVMEQWHTLPGEQHLHNIAQLVQMVRESRTVFVTGAGGAFIAAGQVAGYLSAVAGIPAIAEPAYEFSRLAVYAKPGDLLIAVSQSGETADTLVAAGLAKRWGCRLAVLTNVCYSTLASLADIVCDGSVGEEVCVLSTKSATAQVAFGYLLAHAVAGDLKKALSHMNQLNQSLTNYLVPQTLQEISGVAQNIREEQMFILGQGRHGGTARMAALNIKEASYIHAEAFWCGELKHGVLALVRDQSVVVLIQGSESASPANVAAEVKARGAVLIGIGMKSDIDASGGTTRKAKLFDHIIPVPAVSDPMLDAVATLIPGQLLAYYLAIHRNRNPDKPRNLAKSVTVL